MERGGEWIKMRPNLPLDPKVMAIADHLAADRRFLQWATDDRDIGVTCHVTVAVTVTGLLRVWGVTRRDGVFIGADVFLAYATLDSLDRISGVPAFGDAMACVGWAIPQENKGILFPKLVQHITSKEEREREQAAERQRRKRDKDRDLSRDSHADVTHRVEEKREDKNIEPAAQARVVAASERLAQEENKASEFLTAWNAEKGFNKARTMSPKRFKVFQARLRDPTWSAEWRPALERAARSSFLCGGGERGWKMNIDFFLRPDTLTRILEGQFDDGEPNGSRPGRPVGQSAGRIAGASDKYTSVPTIGANGTAAPGTPQAVPLAE